MVLAQNDQIIANLINKTIIDNPDIVLDYKRLKNVLADIIIDNKLELNVLRMLVDCNIIEEIRESNELNNTMRYRFAKKLTSEYGINEEIANRMVLIWFYSYGKEYLNKDIKE